MWIRSQDKENLTKVKHLSIRYLNGVYSIFTDNHLAPNEICNLATYKTKEKALKVLDEIVEKINYGDLQNVYHMPQDYEVEDA